VCASVGVSDFEYIYPASILLMSEAQKVLVYCHHCKINKKEDHFLYDEIIKLSNDEAVIETVDIARAPDYKEDAFSTKFTSKHTLEYDLVFLPDCGGRWYFAQQGLIWDKYHKISYNLSEQESYLRMMNLRDFVVLHIGSMVKVNGKLVISKFVNPDFLPLLEAAFQKQNWSIEVRKLEGVTDKLLVATKTDAVLQYPDMVLGSAPILWRF